MGECARDSVRNVPFGATELPHPELFEQAQLDFTSYKNILKMLWQIGLDVSLGNLLLPQFQNSKMILSSVINFCCFQMTHLELYQENMARTDELLDLRTQLETEEAALKPELDKLQAIRAKVAPAIKAREDEVAEMKEALAKMNREQLGLKEEIKATKEQVMEVTERMANDNFLLLNAQRESDKLRSQIVRSPEKLKARLASMGDEIMAKKQEVADCTAKLREVQARGFALEKVSGKLAKRLTTMKACEDDKKKGKELHHEIKRKHHETQSEEDRIQGLRATADHLDKQISVCAEKLALLQRQGEQKRVAAQQSLDEAERKKLELGFSIQQDKEQLKENQATIQRKEQELQWMKEEHTREMAMLRQHHLQFAKTLRQYHSEMMEAIPVL